MTKIWNWAETDMADLLGSCERDGLFPLIQKNLAKEGWLLEAGCGAGRYVKFLGDRGWNTVGLEWSSQTLAMVRNTWPELRIVQGDCAGSPFASNVFQSALSLGVVEHWPQGPQLPLSEIFRTLRPGGRAIITVPCLNTVRRLKRSLWWHEFFSIPRTLAVLVLKRRRRRPTRLDRSFRFAVYPAWGDFFEYRMTPHEFARELQEAGFKVLELRPLGEMDGLYHELNPLGLMVKFERWTFHPAPVARRLNEVLSKVPFAHCHMQAAVVEKPEP